MDIDKKTYNLDNKNYHSKEFNKTQIVIGNSFSKDDNHIKSWIHRYGGNYTQTATFTIDRKGKIYQHYDPKFYSDFLDEKRIDKKIISIILENQGWLIKDIKKDKYIDWVGNIYKRRVKVIEKRWRGFNYWDPYTNKQINSCSELVNYLCENYSIPKHCVGHNTFIEDIELFDGIVYKSNYYRENTDLSPAWDFKKFKIKLEKNDKSFSG